MATLVDAPTFLRALPRVQGRLQSLGSTVSATTYCYITALGVRGHTTDLNAIPSGAEIERTVTT